MTREVRAVVFDVGGVLCPSPITAFTRVDDEHGLPPGTTMSVFRGGDTFAQCEVGALALADFSAQCADQVKRELGIDLPPDRFDRMLRGVMGGSTTPEMLDLVQEVKAAGYRIALLTNIVAELREWLHCLLPEGTVDVYADSSELGLRKPDPAIYARLVELLGVAADEIAFVDDFAENLEPAREAGLLTVLYSSPGQTRRDLVAGGVRIATVPQEVAS